MHSTTYRALRRQVLEEALVRSGYGEVTWHEPATSGYYQPIVTAVAL